MLGTAFGLWSDRKGKCPYCTCDIGLDNPDKRDEFDNFESFNEILDCRKCNKLFTPEDQTYVENSSKTIFFRHWVESAIIFSAFFILVILIINEFDLSTSI